MSNTTLKFQCKLSDLVSAMEKYSDVKNVMIENGDDAEGIINCLIEFIGDNTYYEGRERPCNRRVEVRGCKVDGEIVLAALEALDEQYGNEFITCVKKLQELISTTKKGVEDAKGQCFRKN